MSEPAAPPPAEASFQRRRLSGSVHLQHDRGSVWMAWFFGAVIVVIVAGLFLGRLARSESVRGYVSAASGLTRLDAQAAGIVREIAVKQGDTVTRGQRLMQVQLREQTTGGVSTVGATLRSLQDRRTSLSAEQARLSAYLDSTRGDRDETERNVAAVLRALDEQERTLKEGLRQQEEMVARVEAYLRQGYATRETLNGQRRAALDYARQIAELRARRAELRQGTSERLRAQRTGDTEKAAQLASIRNELSTIEAQITTLGAQSRIDVVAPTDGQVAGLYVQPGDSVTADQVVAILGDTRADPLIVLEVPARAIGLAKVGQDVVLKYDAFPFKTFGIAKGTITVISGTPLRNPMLASAEEGGGDTAAAAARQSVYRVEVRPESRTMRAYGTDEPIRIGSTLSADIVVERRRLIDWMLDPIRAMRGRG
ncbi:HlyD family efflux transporter periplasmic adaptor subunit [Methylobacterium currus]|uniref:HlyD family secretion protein n=1 Tax=Methylobacterium currus TaxID=2051553 RepID=UPI001E47210D|nr:HlyD family efflux transporter periplasmic adaptor subunit [Methylobacterium currus]UHC14785.1 HlyD family efflux transporter periplasmic adaptor subunit [Methylobacterium currus]